MYPFTLTPRESFAVAYNLIDKDGIMVSKVMVVKTILTRLEVHVSYWNDNTEVGLWIYVEGDLVFTGGPWNLQDYIYITTF